MENTGYGLLINFGFCTGCHTCEVACQKAHGWNYDEFGIKITQIGPMETNPDPMNRTWEWDFVPVPLDKCDLCADRLAAGKDPSCVHHCLAKVIEYDMIEKLAKRAREIGSKTAVFLP